MWLSFVFSSILLCSTSQLSYENGLSNEVISCAEQFFIFLKEKHTGFEKTFKILNTYYDEFSSYSEDKKKKHIGHLTHDVSHTKLKDRCKDENWKSYNQNFVDKYPFERISDEEITKLYEIIKKNIQELIKIKDMFELWKKDVDITKHFKDSVRWHYKHKNIPRLNDSPTFFKNNFKEFINDRIDQIDRKLKKRDDHKIRGYLHDAFSFYNDSKDKIYEKIIIFMYYALIKKLERYIFFVLEISHFESGLEENLEIYNLKNRLEIIKKCKTRFLELNKTDFDKDNEAYCKLLIEVFGLKKILSSFLCTTRPSIKFKFFKEKCCFNYNPDKDTFIDLHLSDLNDNFIPSSKGKKEYDYNFEILKKLIGINLKKFAELYQNYDYINDILPAIKEYNKKQEEIIKGCEILKENTLERLSKLNKNDFKELTNCMSHYFSAILNYKKALLVKTREIAFNPMVFWIFEDGSIFKQIINVFNDCDTQPESKYNPLTDENLVNINSKIIKKQQASKDFENLKKQEVSQMINESMEKFYFTTLLKSERYLKTVSPTFLCEQALSFVKPTSLNDRDLFLFNLTFEERIESPDD